MLEVHTVAAGGGSLLHLMVGVFRPGLILQVQILARRYRRGGPLAVTDANVMVGKLQPELLLPFLGRMSGWMRRSYGRSYDLAEEVGRPPEVVAEGFLRIAVENMANAIKKISVQRAMILRSMRSIALEVQGSMPVRWRML